MGFLAGLGSIITGGLGLLGGAASSAIDYRSQKKLMQKQYEYNSLLQQQQQDYNTQMWNSQNAYNTPQQQMDRLQAAGLNPHLVYGGGSSSSSGLAGGAPTSSGGSVGLPRGLNTSNILPNVVQMMSGFFDLEQKKIQTDVMKSQKDAQIMQANADMLEHSRRMAGMKYLRDFSPELWEKYQYWKDYDVWQGAIRGGLQTTMQRMSNDVFEATAMDSAKQALALQGKQLRLTDKQIKLAINQAEKVKTETDIIKFERDFGNDFGFNTGQGRLIIDLLKFIVGAFRGR